MLTAFLAVSLPSKVCISGFVLFPRMSITCRAAQHLHNQKRRITGLLRPGWRQLCDGITISHRPWSLATGHQGASINQDTLVQDIIAMCHGNQGHGMRQLVTFNLIRKCAGLGTMQAIASDPSSAEVYPETAGLCV